MLWPVCSASSEDDDTINDRFIGHTNLPSFTSLDERRVLEESLKNGIEESRKASNLLCNAVVKGLSNSDSYLELITLLNSSSRY